MKLPIYYDRASRMKRRDCREQYIDEQQGLCYHCDTRLDMDPPKFITDKPVTWALFPRGESFLDYPIHLHHDHNTGLTIGAVHAYCNAVLFEYHGE